MERLVGPSSRPADRERVAFLGGRFDAIEAMAREQRALNYRMTSLEQRWLN